MITGLAKILSAFGHAQMLKQADPITGIRFGHLMLVVGMLELCLVGVCLFAKSQRWALASVAIMAGNFVAYRVGLWWIGWHKACTCLGSLTDALHIRPELADNIMKVILAYLLVGSSVFFALLWQNSRCLRPESGQSKARPHFVT